MGGGGELSMSVVQIPIQLTTETKISSSFTVYHFLG